MAAVPPDRNQGDQGHIADHLLINDAIAEFEAETVAMQAQIAAILTELGLGGGGGGGGGGVATDTYSESYLEAYN